MIKVKLMREGGRLPTRAYVGDAGADLYAAEEVYVEAHSTVVVPTGIAIEGIEDDEFGFIAPRGSTAKAGLAAIGTVVDSGYRGEIMVPVWNLNCTRRRIVEGAKFCQLVIVRTRGPVEFRWFDGEFVPTFRSEKRFGSSG